MKRIVLLLLALSCLTLFLEINTAATAQARVSALQGGLNNIGADVAAPWMQAGATGSEKPRAAALSSQPPQLDAAALKRVTARVIGEGSFAIPQIACTVRNRWHAYHHAGLDAVLAAYHAQDVPPQPWQVELVRQIFAGELPCPASWWYALSLQDTHSWTPHDRVATIVVRDAKSQVWIFER